jgi:transcriptional regulator with XRE-family HTH domain
MTDRGGRFRLAMAHRKVRKQFALAVDLGVDQSTLSRWSKGATLTLDNATRLCEALDISLDWLLLGRGEMEQHKKRGLTEEEWQLVLALRRLPDEVRSSLTRHVRALQHSYPGENRSKSNGDDREHSD